MENNGVSRGISSEFGNLIRNRRQSLKLSAEKLAEKCDRSDREIRDIELGRSEPLLSTALLLCNACGIEIGELQQFVPDLTACGVAEAE